LKYKIMEAFKCNLSRQKAGKKLENKILGKVFELWRRKFVRNLHFRVLYHGIEQRQVLRNALKSFSENSKAEKEDQRKLENAKVRIEASIRKGVFKRLQLFVEQRVAKRDNAFKAYFFQENWEMKKAFNIFK
jgi:hypothetical protein